MDSQMAAQVSQSLFIRNGFDGSTWEFAALVNGGCALLRDGAAVTTADGTEPSVEQLLQEFFRVTTAYAAVSDYVPGDADADELLPAAADVPADATGEPEFSSPQAA